MQLHVIFTIIYYSKYVYVQSKIKLLVSINNKNKLNFLMYFQIEFIKTLPKTISGKIRRVELREKNKIF